MSKFILIVEDAEDGRVGLSWDFDPPLNLEEVSVEDSTGAVKLGASILLHITENNNLVMDEDED